MSNDFFISVVVTVIVIMISTVAHGLLYGGLHTDEDHVQQYHMDEYLKQEIESLEAELKRKKANQ